MVIAPFRVARLPALHFGEGSLEALPALARSFGRRALLVTGRASLEASPCWPPLERALRGQGLEWGRARVTDEPSPETIDAAVAAHRDAGVDVVLGVGGGSALDAAKAVAGLLRTGNPVLDHLEGVGPDVPYQGPAVPFIAVPTTAGTGSEATKNAVISSRGPQGYKKSFRDERLIARHAVVDPRLLETCPPGLIAADGMDALTQLVESYVSTRASPWTDALCESGLRAAREGLLPWYESAGEHDTAAARSAMAYAALISGIALAQTGLGAVHGLASPLGALFPAPHGAVCGCLVAEATAVNVDALRRRDPHGTALERYGRMAAMLGAARADADALVELLREWTGRLDLPRLGRFGVRAEDVPSIVAGSRGSSMRTNPLVLSDEEVAEIVGRRL